jgi:hypothetical protein
MSSILTFLHVVKVKVTLRLTVYRQTVRLGDKPLDTHDQRLFFLTEHLCNILYDERLDLSLMNMIGLTSSIQYVSHIQHVTEHSSLCTVYKFSISTGFANLWFSRCSLCTDPQRPLLPTVPRLLRVYLLLWEGGADRIENTWPRVVTVLFPSSWLHNPGFQQVCHNMSINKISGFVNRSPGRKDIWNGNGNYYTTTMLLWQTVGSIRNCRVVPTTCGVAKERHIYRETGPVQGLDFRLWNLSANLSILLH